MIDLPNLAVPEEPAGVLELAPLRALADDRGAIGQWTIDLPPFERACYFAAFQRYDPPGEKAGELDWPGGANRVQGLVVEDFADVAPGGRMCVLRLAGGEYLALLPMVSSRAMAWFDGGEALTVSLGTLGTDGLGDAPLPVLAWARDADLHAACREAWREAVKHPDVAGSTRLRDDKPYPPIFEYLGWCTWEQWHKAIDHDVLAEAIDALEACELPVRYVLIDDGHIDTGATFTDHRGREHQALRSFAANEKFPEGLEALVARRSDKLRFWGLWLNFNGYWGGIDPDNELGGLNELLAPVGRGCLQPAPGRLASLAFYDAFIADARAKGFDFVKVDYQAANLQFYRGMANAVASAAENSQALETACAHHTDGLINCMAHNAVCAFNTRSSVVTRCSEDYKLNDAWRAKAHLHNSYQNILWLGHTVWGDHDMFHSCDTFAGGIMARSKAISGGPVYLSDLPSEFRPEVVGPLCFADGRLLRPLAPAAPLPDSAFVDPFVGGEAYRAVAPLPNAAAALACYNLTEPTVPVDVRVTGEEYVHAGAMLQGPDAGAWERPAEGLVIYDVKRSVALAPGEAFEATLAEFDDELLLLLPVLAGWAVVGRCDKYLPPAGVEVIDAAEGELIVRMLETGPLAVWSTGGEVSCDTGEAIREQGAAPQSGPSLWRVDLPVGEADVVVRLRRR